MTDELKTADVSPSPLVDLGARAVRDEIVRLRPKDSDADDWHLWLSSYADSRAAFPDVLRFLAVQIAEAIVKARQDAFKDGAKWGRDMARGE